MGVYFYISSLVQKYCSGNLSETSLASYLFKPARFPGRAFFFQVEGGTINVSSAHLSLLRNWFILQRT